MAKKENKISRRKLASSYITSVISISLVLFFLGLIGLLVLNTKKISDHVKENIVFRIILNDNAKDVEVRLLQKKLEVEKFVKSTEYISREQAAKEYMQELGEDFVQTLNFNPLKETIDIYLHAPYANPDSLIDIEKQFVSYPLVNEIYYRKTLVHEINDNVRTISFYILGFSLILFLIAIVLINNTVRLTIYSRRLIIKTMQLVGATNEFIRRPFLLQGILHGIYGAVIAIGLLSAIIYFLQNELIDTIGFKEIEIIMILFTSVLIIGIIITWISTFFSVNKYLYKKADEVYY